MEVFDVVFRLAFLAQVINHAMPYMFAALAGVLCERSGVVNIALEGKLLVGAFCCALGGIETGSLWVGVLSGAAGGTLVAALYALVVLRFRANQIVAGVAINLLAVSLTRLLLKLFYDSTANSPAAPGLDGEVWSDPFLYLCIVLAVLVHFCLTKTRAGLRLRAVGESAKVASALGISVSRVRWSAVLSAGSIAGLGGAWLTLSNAGFVADMSGGRGYIALAAVIMGAWRPVAAIVACFLFAVAEALQVGLQVEGIGLPTELLLALPHLLAVVAMAGFVGRRRAPADLGK